MKFMLNLNENLLSLTVTISPERSNFKHKIWRNLGLLTVSIVFYRSTM